MKKQVKKIVGESKASAEIAKGAPKELPAPVMPSADVLAAAQALVAERKLTKMAHKPNGEKVWLHMVEIPEELRKGIADYMFANPSITIHQLGELALTKFLGVKEGLPRTNKKAERNK